MNIHKTVAELRAEVERLEREKADQGLTLATLCDLILGEDAGDRSDTALVRGASVLVREQDELLHKMQLLRNEVARLNGQTMWVCTCGGTDCAGRKENAALRESLAIEQERSIYWRNIANRKEAKP